MTRLIRGPLLNAFALGWGVSMMISSTLVPRLLVDGAISFLFVPAFQLLAFWIVFRRRGPEGRFDVAVERFFASNTPWLVLVFGLALWGVVQSPFEAALWSWNEVLAALGAMVLAAAWSWWLERDQLRPGESLLYRAIAWPAVSIYFLGIATWADVRWMLA